ncbi:hypothetical protein NM688_g8191 [Phlebia brevispora]|uniref:Uncharacterized protein n=1 Tax=Phlebia brevispora TaxID=194682 RepID=A0ACC1RW43_9APHY|nr:hypothetical protein NM688_g8191 [Phlebia brevispora]
MAKASVHHLYHGQRREEFYPQDVNELIELRARQRTFDGAYGRSALSNLGYALTILRIFDKRFYKIGILYTVLAGVLYVIAFLRQRHSLHDFADSSWTHPSFANPIQTKGQIGKRIFGRPFVTAGWIVVLLTAVVAGVEIGLLVLIFQHSGSPRTVDSIIVIASGGFCYSSAIDISAQARHNNPRCESGVLSQSKYLN